MKAYDLETGIRQTGRTTTQIKRAPKNAYYMVWRSSMIPSVREKAKELGRPDLTIVGPDFLDRWHGVDIPDIVVDHCTWDQLTGKEIGLLADLQTSINCRR